MQVQSGGLAHGFSGRARLLMRGFRNFSWPARHVLSVSAVVVLVLSCGSGSIAGPIASKRGSITAVWANDGGDKVTRDELRARVRAPRNSIWDGQRIRLFSAANETVSVNLVIEAAEQTATDVRVHFSDLTHGSADRLRSNPGRTKQKLFDWTSTQIELFYVRYLKIKGLSQLSYGTYEERHIPERLRRPSTPEGVPFGTWKDRPGADRFFPDIAVPLELVGAFDISARSNQSIWVDIYVPRETKAGVFTGEIAITEAGLPVWRIPVQLTVMNFALPDEVTSRTMVATSYEEIARRYTGQSYPAPNSRQDSLVRRVADRQFMLAHRHRISLVDDNSGAAPWVLDRPRPEWMSRLTGKLYSRANAYAGPGEGVGHDIFVVGLYGAWMSWWGGADEKVMRERSKAWEVWFQKNFPGVDRFIYLSDESEDYRQTEQWAAWLKPDRDGAPALASFATANLVDSLEAMPSLSIFASWIGVGDTPVWDQAARTLRETGRRLFLYNGLRPASGSFAIEDDGVALRELPWGQYKKGVDRWFFWNATYYLNYQGGRGDTNVFVEAQTFGGTPAFDEISGLTGWNTSNGDGVLLYPGTDAIFPEYSYDLEGPIASLRLKHWRRGIQDVEYLAMAEAVDKAATWAIIQRMVPKVLWETGVASPDDPTWVRGPVGWNTKPDDWEAARKELARIIERR